MIIKLFLLFTVGLATASGNASDGNVDFVIYDKEPELMHQIKDILTTQQINRPPYMRWRGPTDLQFYEQLYGLLSEYLERTEEAEKGQLLDEIEQISDEAETKTGQDKRHLLKRKLQLPAHDIVDKRHLLKRSADQLDASPQKWTPEKRHLIKRRLFKNYDIGSEFTKRHLIKRLMETPDADVLTKRHLIKRLIGYVTDGGVDEETGDAEEISKRHLL